MVTPTLDFKDYFSQLHILKLDNPFKIHTGMPIARDSEFWSLFRHELMRFRENGLMRRAKANWFDQPLSASHSPGSEEAATSLGYESVAFPFLILCFGAGTAALIEFFESMKK